MTATGVATTSEGIECAECEKNELRIGQTRARLNAARLDMAYHVRRRAAHRATHREAGNTCPDHGDQPDGPGFCCPSMTHRKVA